MYRYIEYEKHANPRDPILITGQHATQLEIDLTFLAIVQIRKIIGSESTITLVGSRALERWISKKRFINVCKPLGTEMVEFWFNEANNIAKKRLLARHEIILLPQIEPITFAPDIIHRFLLGEFGPAGSDIDLRLDDYPARPKGVRKFYTDPSDKTNQVIDVWGVNEKP